MDMNDKTPWSFVGENSSVTFRNLRKNDLGGVIFGCKHNTMAECLSKQIFGLPYSDISYVRNIGAGLPLFLFNYSDRRLHGIYEAATDGQLYIDAYAWTDAGAERTPFPAQVYIRIKTQCQPLTEDQFKKTIEDNYYASQLFWFELDHAQTRDLISLFKPSPSPMNRMLTPSLPRTAWKAIITGEHLNSKSSMPQKSVNSSKDTVSEPNSNWNDIVTRDHLNIDASRPQKNVNPPINMVNGNKFAPLHCNGNIKHASSVKASSTDHEEMHSRETVSDWEELIEDAEKRSGQGAFRQSDGANQTSHKLQSSNDGLVSEEERVLRMLKELAAHRERKISSSKHNTVDNVAPYDPGNSHETNGQIDESSFEAEEKDSSTGPDVDQGNNDVEVEKKGSSTGPDVHHGSNEAAKISRALDVTEKNAEIDSDQEVLQLKNLVVRDAGHSIQSLKDRVQVAKSKVDSSNALVGSSLDTAVAQCLDLGGVIYLIGGSDGHSSLASLDSFSPSLDTLTPLKSMRLARSYVTAVALDGIIFVIGGGDDGSWFDTVEYYDRRNDEWALCPSMLCEKGQLGAAALDGKIFVIGGRDEKECFSDVEMFDPVVGKWLKHQPMIWRRFAHSVAELNGAIYAVGGYNEYEYLRSAEKMDPRERYWIELPSMKTRRACHSMTVFNEKLYCMGGYDANEMVSSVEIYDPRINSWMMGEPMKCSRGFAAAAVLDDSLFAIGGAVGSQEFVNTVECYKEGAGWTTNDWKAIANRSHFSAVVL